MSVTRISDARPTWSDWTGTAGADENTNQTELDFGSVAASANSTHKNLSLEFSSTFDDSVYENIRFWMLNQPGLTDHVWYALGVTTATTPATTALTGGAAIGTTPDTATKLAAGTYYDGTNNAIRYLQLQLQCGASSQAWNQGNELITNPVLVGEFQRTDSATTKLRDNYSMQDLAEGFLFTFSDVELFENVGGKWQLQAAIKEDSFDINLAEETVDWAKGKPSVTYHQAIASKMTEAKFQLDACDPRFIARALDTAAAENATDNTVDVDIDGITRPVIYSDFILQWRTIGGHIVRLEIPKGKLALTGSMQPGASEFAGLEFTIKGLAENTTNKRVSTIRYSRTPVEQAFIPITYVTT